MAKHIFLASIGVIVGIVLTGSLGAKVDPKHERTAIGWLVVMVLLCVCFAAGLIWLGGD